MNSFLIATAVLSLVAMAFVAVPLLRRRSHAESADRKVANIALYRERIAELDVQRDAGEIGAEEHEALTAEAQAALLEDAQEAADAAREPPPPTVAATKGDSWKLLAVVVVALLGAAVLVYREIGAIDLVALDRDRALLTADSDDQAALANWAARLESHLARHPDDAKIWYLLGHARMRQANYKAAVTAFETLLSLAAGETTVMSLLAQARYLADEGVVTEENRALMNRVIAVAPHESVVREILALDAFRAGRFAEAAVHLESALAGGIGGARADAMRTALERARAASGTATVEAAGGTSTDAGAAGIEVEVGMGALDPSVHPGAALFVFARRPGERMPLLVARVDAVAPVTRARLDAGNAMQPGVVPVAGEQLEIVARFSPSGRVAQEPGAREASGTIVWGRTGTAQLALTDDAAAAAAAPASGATGPVRLRVALGNGVNPPSGSRVFVILREIGGPPMPVAVRPLDPGRLPAEIEMSDADAMQPGRVVSQFAKLEVEARLSASGSAMRQPDDVSSDVVSVLVGASETVNLVIGGQ